MNRFRAALPSMTATPVEAALGSTAPRVRNRCHQRLCSMLIRAALDGMGVAIERPTVMASELREGTLGPVFGTFAAKLPEPPCSKLTLSNVKIPCSIIGRRGRTDPDHMARPRGCGWRALHAVHK